jgi:hypothetical protein
LLPTFATGFYALWAINPEIYNPLPRSGSSLVPNDDIQYRMGGTNAGFNALRAKKPLPHRIITFVTIIHYRLAV